MKLLLIFVLYGFVHGKTRIDPLVSTKHGLIRGLRGDDGDYAKFLGLPYALVDEKNPFGAAIPHPGFDDVFEAYDDSTICVQLSRTGDITGTIQCLQLHIFVPNKASSQNLLPVMVSIHGGGFIRGSSAGDHPRTLVENGVIVVSISYRLGVYGFLCLDNPEVPGNQGLKDQVLALKWIKENIESFGGNPTQITAFGESAGGSSINLHLYSDYEKLFDRAIIQSGVALSPFTFVLPDSIAPLRLAEQLGYNTTDINDALSYLSSANPLLVTAAADKTEFHAVKPCLEKRFDGVQSFITEHVMNTKKAPKLKSTSVIIGYTDEEMGTEFINFPDKQDYDHYFEELFYAGFARDENLGEALQLVKHFYVGDETNSDINMRHQTVKYATDLIFGHPTQRMVEQFTDAGAKAVYRYIFSYIGNKNVTGASHGAEMPFLFDKSQYDPTLNDDKNEEEQLLFERMTTLWTNFAKYGNPTPEASDLLPLEWKAATKDEQFSLDINSELTLKKRPDHERMTFWDLFFKLYGKYQIWYKDDSE